MINYGARKKMELLPKVSDLPAKQVGNYRIHKFTITPEEAAVYNLKATIRGVEDMVVEPGDYTSLLRGSGAKDIVVMSDTPSERRDHVEIVKRGHGHVLVNGLGLGVVLNALCMSLDVDKVTVIEFAPEVVALVGKFYREKFPGRVEIIQGNALQYRPPAGVHYGAVWNDIWDTISPDNLPDMRLLQERYEPISDWCGSWREETCQWMDGEESRALHIAKTIHEHEGDWGVVPLDDQVFLRVYMARVGL